MPASSVGSKWSVAAARIQVPRLPVRTIRRCRLADRLLDRRVTLICAAAGSGKTLLTADWAHSAQQRGDRIAWLAVDPTDDKPYEFWSAVLESLQLAGPEDVAAELAQLSPPRDQFERGFVESLLDVLSHSPYPTRLVLDDVHRISHPEVVAGVDHALSLLPDQFQVILIGRREPAFALHELQLRDELQRIDGQDLAFTEPEAAELYATFDLQLTDQDVARLVTRTEGWAAGLRLAAVPLSRGDASRTSVISFDGDQRELGDYLFAEIVQQLPADLYRFLLATCAPRQLPIELAAELSGRTDAGELLDELCRSNVLVVQTGDATGYRYHSLLRQFLLAALHRQDAGQPARQHAQTARWLDDHQQPVSALSHAVVSGDNELLTELIGRHGLRLTLSGVGAQVLQIIDAVPGVADRPAVATIAALAALDARNVPRADHWLAVLRQQPAPQGSVELALRASAQVQRTLLGGDVAEAVDRTAILALDRTGDVDTDLMVLAHRPSARVRSGDYPGAIADLQQALALARAGRYNQLELWILSQLAGMTGAMCDIQQSRVWAEEAIRFAAPRGWSSSPRLAYAYLMAAWSAFQTGDAEEQRRIAELGMAALDRVNNVEVELGVRSMAALATFEAAAGPERRQAVEEFHRLWAVPEADQASPALTGHARTQEIRLALLVGEQGWAAEALQRTKQRLPDSAEVAVNSAQLALAQGRQLQAFDLLGPVAREKLITHLPDSVVIANVMIAQLECARGHIAAALAAFRRALDRAEPQNLQRPFLDGWARLKPLVIPHLGEFGTANDFVESVLGRADPRHGVTEVELLSPKQLELLRDLQSVLPIRELAAARGVSVNTTRSHLRAIYRKLGVSSRSDAVRLARDRGLL